MTNSDPRQSPAVGRANEPASANNANEPVDVPRRFSAVRMTVFAATYAVFFAVLTSLGIPAVDLVVGTVFVTGVGVSQVRLFGGRRPLLASLLAGISMWILIASVSAIWRGVGIGRFFGVVAFILFSAVPFGLIFGWSAGILAIGVSMFIARDTPQQGEELAAPEDRLAKMFIIGRSTVTVGIPRRFSVGVMMVFVTMYAALFAILTSLAVPPAAFLIITVFVTGVGVSQAVLFGGRRPRDASLLAGIYMWMLITLAAVPWLMWEGTQSSDLAEIVAFNMLGSIVAGPLCGYFAGALVASIFLFIRQDCEETAADAEAASAPEGPIVAKVVEVEDRQ